MQEIIERHERIALQLSGGRDSIACLYMMRPWLDRITVYWLNTGAAFPETVAVIDRLKEMAPHFVEVQGRQPDVVAQFGMPSDIVPVSSTPVGIVCGGSNAPLMQDRYTCCFRTIMQPMHQRMIEDGITLIIRGQKEDDHHKAPIRSGHVEDGVEYLLPIEGWSKRQVMDYLQQEGAPIPRFYQMLDGAPDCMTCTAWWENGAVAYLKRYHYTEYQEVQRRLEMIRDAVSGHIAHFNTEVNS